MGSLYSNSALINADKYMDVINLVIGLRDMRIVFLMVGISFNIIWSRAIRIKKLQEG